MRRGSFRPHASLWPLLCCWIFSAKRSPARKNREEGAIVRPALVAPSRLSIPDHPRAGACMAAAPRPPTEEEGWDRRSAAARASRRGGPPAGTPAACLETREQSAGATHRRLQGEEPRTRRRHCKKRTFTAAPTPP